MKGELNTKSSESEFINVNELLNKYFTRWKWFVASILISLVAALLMLRYSPKIYQSKAKLLIKYEKAGSYSELSAFNDLGLIEGASGYNNLYNEKEILHSSELIEKVINKLHLNVEYTIIGTKTGIERSELYTGSPIQVHILAKDSTLEESLHFEIKIKDNQTFTFDSKLIGTKNYQFGELIEIAGKGKAFVSKTALFNSNWIGKIIAVNYSPTSFKIPHYQSLLSIEPIGEEYDILELTLRGKSINKNNDFLNQLIEEHTKQTISDQKLIYNNTTDFINERIKAISLELEDVEEEGQDYQKDYQFSDIFLNEKSLYDRVFNNEKNLSSAEIQLELIQFMQDYMDNNTDKNSLLPANLGLESVEVNENIALFNKLLIEKNKTFGSAGSENPQLKKYNLELESLYSTIKSSLYTLESTIKLQVKQLKQDQRELDAGISQLPNHKRIVRSIERQQQVKESLYIYLLQKREENEIASAITEGNSKIIESAYCNGVPVSPNKKVYYAAALLLGLFIPFSFISIQSFFDNKIKTPEDLKKYGFSFLGSIPKVKDEEKQVIRSGAHSAIAESFRILRTNTSFLLDDDPTVNGKVILCTSTIAKEGKSFISLNMGVSYALTQKKTVIVGFDLRAPKLGEYAHFLDNDGKGITNFIMDNKIKIEDIIIESGDTENLFYLPSGTIPPNPSELIIRERTVELFELLKEQFDIIIVDSAPIGLVTDSTLLTKFADAVLYITRANYLDKRLLDVAENYIEKNNLNNVGFIVNSLDNTKANGYGYGYGYTYGYGDGKEQSGWNKWLKKLGLK